MIWVALVVLVALLLGIMIAVIRVGILALGTPRDRAAGNQMLAHAASLLGGRFRDRTEYPWYRRPAQYGAVEGELGDLSYLVNLMPWNAEDCGGQIMLHIHSRLGGTLPTGGSRVLIFIPVRTWHWPDLADPAVLADYARQALTSVSYGILPPDAS